MPEYVYHVKSGGQYDDGDTSDNVVFNLIEDAKNFKPDDALFPSQFDEVDWVEHDPDEYWGIVAGKYIHPIDATKPPDNWNSQTWLVIVRLEVR